MVCRKCERANATVLGAPDPATTSAGRQIGGNKLLSKKTKPGVNPYARAGAGAGGAAGRYGNKCLECKSSIESTKTRCEWTSGLGDVS